MNKIIEAVQFAAMKHRGQTRKGTGRPYTDHLYRVAGAMAEVLNAESLSENLVVAALLHDTLEDTTTTKEEISMKFGHDVLSYVVAMTKAKDDRPRRVRNAEYFGTLKNAHIAVKILKMIDRLDNLGEVENMDPSFIKKYCEESLDLLKAVGGADAALKKAIEERVNELYLLKS